MGGAIIHRFDARKPPRSCNSHQQIVRPPGEVGVVDAASGRAERSHRATASGKGCIFCLCPIPRVFDQCLGILQQTDSRDRALRTRKDAENGARMLLAAGAEPDVYPMTPALPAPYREETRVLRSCGLHRRTAYPSSSVIRGRRAVGTRMMKRMHAAPCSGQFLLWNRTAPAIHLCGGRGHITPPRRHAVGVISLVGGPGGTPSLNRFSLEERNESTSRPRQSSRPLLRPIDGDLTLASPLQAAHLTQQQYTLAARGWSSP